LDRGAPEALVTVAVIVTGCPALEEGLDDERSKFIEEGA
jgi:hypothetical protein